MLAQSYWYADLSEGPDSVGGQLRRDKGCPFSSVTNSGRVWRKVPESDARSVSLVRGIRRSRGYQKQSGEYGKVCKVEDSHRGKTFSQCPSADRTQTPSTGLRHPSSKEEGAGKRYSERAPYLRPMPPSSLPAAALIQQFENKECVFPAGGFLFVHRGYFVGYPQCPGPPGVKFLYPARFRRFSFFLSSSFLPSFFPSFLCRIALSACPSARICAVKEIHINLLSIC